MPIDPYIASGIKLPQFNLPDYGADMAQMAQIQNARNQNALAQYQLGAAQRAEAKDVARTNALMRAGSDESQIAQALLEAGDIKGYSDFIKAKEERQKTGLEIKKSESALLSDEINRAADAMAKAQTIEAYEAILNKVHDPQTRTGKYFQSIGFDPSSSNQAISEAKNDPTGQKFLQLRAQSGLKGKEFAEFILARGQEQELQAGRNTPAVPATSTQFGPRQQDVLINALSLQNAMPAQNAMIEPVAVPPSALTTVAPLAAAPLAAAPQSRIDFVKSEINRISNVLNTSPGNKLASDRLKALTDEYNQLSAEQGREATLKENIRAAGVREKLDQAKYDLEINKFNASQKEFKVEKTPQGLVQINKDGTVAPILGADGNQVQSLEFAKSEFKVNADGNYIAFNPYTNQSRIVTGADGKPVRSLDAATKAEQERHNRELERQGVIKIGQENRRIQLSEQQLNQPKYNAERGGFVYPPTKENPEGKFVALTGGDGKPLTEAQGNSTAYGMRMTQANQIIEKLASEGTNRAAIGAGAPFVGGIVNAATASPQQQQFQQAKLNFITAILRKESGAAIGQDEFEREDQKYFPQVQDSNAVKAQKAQARQTAIEAMKIQAGPGAKEIQKFAASGGASAVSSSKAIEDLVNKYAPK